jgi:hypothetical protein
VLEELADDKGVMLGEVAADLRRFSRRRRRLRLLSLRIFVSISFSLFPLHSLERLRIRIVHLSGHQIDAFTIVHCAGRGDLGDVNRVRHLNQNRPSGMKDQCISITKHGITHELRSAERFRDCSSFPPFFTCGFTDVYQHDVPSLPTHVV